MTVSTQVALTIAAGASVSTTLQVPPQLRIAAIAIPAGWTAADIGFNVGNAVDGSGVLSGGQPLYAASGSIYSAKAAASKTTLLSPQDLTAFNAYQLVSLSAGTANALNQVSTVVLTVYLDDAF